MKMNRFTTILWDLDQTILDFENRRIMPCVIALINWG